MLKVIRIDDRGLQQAAQCARRQSVGSTRNLNQHERASLIKRFLFGGKSVRALGPSHPEGEAGVNQELREAILAGNRLVA